jgi:hypothetical protein
MFFVESMEIEGEEDRSPKCDRKPRLIHRED